MRKYERKDELFKQTNEDIDKSLDGINEVATDVSDDVITSTSLVGNVGKALSSDEEKKNPFKEMESDFSKEDEKKESSFKQAVRMQETRLQAESDKNKVRYKDNSLER